VLRDRFGATEVWLFGSVLTGRVHEGSDLDLAARGVPDERFYSAVAAASRAAGMHVDLVDLDACPASLLRTVEARGVRLDV
jgi:predicted nucleotidyltransferase